MKAMFSAAKWLSVCNISKYITAERWFTSRLSTSQLHQSLYLVQFHPHTFLII